MEIRSFIIFQSFSWLWPSGHTTWCHLESVRVLWSMCSNAIFKRCKHTPKPAILVHVAVCFNYRQFSERHCNVVISCADVHWSQTLESPGWEKAVYTPIFTVFVSRPIALYKSFILVLSLAFYVKLLNLTICMWLESQTL